MEIDERMVKDLLRVVRDLRYRLDSQEKAIKNLDQRASGVEAQVKRMETDMIMVKSIRRK